MDEHFRWSVERGYGFFGPTCFGFTYGQLSAHERQDPSWASIHAILYMLDMGVRYVFWVEEGAHLQSSDFAVPLADMKKKDVYYFWGQGLFIRNTEWSKALLRRAHEVCPTPLSARRIGLSGATGAILTLLAGANADLPDSWNGVWEEQVQRDSKTVRVHPSQADNAEIIPTNVDLRHRAKISESHHGEACSEDD